MDHLIGFVGTYGPAIAAALICLAASLVAAFLLVLTWGDAEVELGSVADLLIWGSIWAVVVAAPVGAFALTGVPSDIVNAARATIGVTSSIALFAICQDAGHSFGYWRRPTALTPVLVLGLAVIVPIVAGIPLALLVADWLPAELFVVYVVSVAVLGAVAGARERRDMASGRARRRADERDRVPVDRLLARWRTSWITIAAQEDPAFARQLDAKGWRADRSPDKMAYLYFAAVRATEGALAEPARRRLDLVDYSNADLKLGLSSPERGVREFTAAIAIDPLDATVWALRATSRAMWGDSTGAGEDFDHALALAGDPDLATLIEECRAAADRISERRGSG